MLGWHQSSFARQNPSKKPTKSESKNLDRFASENSNRELIDSPPCIDLNFKRLRNIVHFIRRWEKKGLGHVAQKWTGRTAHARSLVGGGHPGNPVCPWDWEIRILSPVDRRRKSVRRKTKDGREENRWRCPLQRNSVYLEISDGIKP